MGVFGGIVLLWKNVIIKQLSNVLAEKSSLKLL